MDRSIFERSNGSNGKGNNPNEENIRVMEHTIIFPYHLNDQMRNMKIGSRGVLMEEEDVAIASWILAM
jgi:hypothetical protein